MNKILRQLSILTGVILLCAACTKDPMPYMSETSGDVVTVKFSVGKEVSTRVGENDLPSDISAPTGTISDGSRTNMLICAVYDADGKLLPQYGNNEYGQLIMTDIQEWPVTVPIRLVRNQEYKIAFWAQNSDCKAYETSDLHNVTVNYGDINRANNDESRDAFCKTEPFTAAENGTRTVILRRPFAQINVGVKKSDFEAACKGECRIVESKIRIVNVATCLDVVTNSVDTNPDKLQAIEYDFATIPAYINMKDEAGIQRIPTELYDEPEDDEGETGPTGNYYNGQPVYTGSAPQEYLYVDLNNDGKYNAYDSEDPEVFKYLSMCYVLVADRTDGTSTYGTTLDRVELYFKSRNASRDIIVIDDQSLRNIPVQRNWRTNIVGELLTTDVRLSVSVDQRFAGQFNSPDWVIIDNGVGYDPSTGDILISNGLGLQWVSDMSNGVYTDPTKDEKLIQEKGMDYAQARKQLILKITNENNNGEWPSYNYFHFHDVTIRLLNDVDFAKADEIEGLRREWTPIAYDYYQGSKYVDNYESSRYFKGHFDGGNHTISNLRTVRPEKSDKNNGTGKYDTRAMGFISTCSYGSSIKNLRLKDVDILGHYYTGAIAGIMFYGVGIENCYVDGGTITNTWAYRYAGHFIIDIYVPEFAQHIGGIIGQMDNTDGYNWNTNGPSHIINCDVRNVTIRGSRNIGGLIGNITAENWWTDPIQLENNSVTNVRIVSDHFQNYTRATADDDMYYYKGIFIGNDARTSPDYQKEPTPTDKCTAYNTYIYPFDIKGRSCDIAEDTPLDIFPKLINSSSYSSTCNTVNFHSNISGTPSAYKSYTTLSNGEEEFNTKSGKVGIYMQGLTLVGTNGNEADLNPDFVLTVEGANNPDDCAVYIKNSGTITDLTIRGDKELNSTGGSYAYTGICLAPSSTGSITLNNVYVYDVVYTLNDDNGNNTYGNLTVNNSNLRGWTKYNKWRSVTFNNTIFDRGTGSTGSEYDYAILTAGTATTFNNCTFRKDFCINNENNVRLTFSNCWYGTGTDLDPLVEITADNVQDLLQINPAYCTFK